MNPTRFMDIHPAGFYHPDAMKTLLILLALLLTHPATACINVDGTSIDGSVGSFDGVLHYDQTLKAVLHETPEEQAALLQTRYQNPPENPFSRKELEGVVHILRGNPAQAITIFKELEVDRPGQYSTAANLGTAYELNGELENALTWIRQGLVRNNNSHHDTEWLHVEILKTRIKLREDPDYLRQNHVINLPDTYIFSSPVRIGDDTRAVSDIQSAILHQLKERILFVKPPDSVVADLLFTLGQITAHTMNLESSLGLLNMSSDYGYANPAQLTATISQYERTILYRQSKKWVLISLGVITGLGLLYLGWRKKIFFLSSKSNRAHRAATTAR
ncbi:MAG: tetratricopeptide repeat protein [Verrucomicrobiaceae bacterium]|nr:MAG: tetratricopeptide repeat protein [Verrucomicrobiaceae bacterium]